MRCGFGVGGAKEVLTFCQPFKDRFGALESLGTVVKTFLP